MTTGKMSFNERKKLSDHLNGKAVDASVPKLVSMANKVLYTPQSDKLEGYT